ncbi:UDP-3-O-(3-hydroxymyristoyl)glucosamine N-acyltransferase [Pleionea sediminis]|uniref:UDP-3-O-(3-hydroxymyristoyl)glucosamine N-acyltransferase n=1 Tax=Pleionea sediminis TaxID=2569479 RepID=UPI001185391E|nr:UDP-3-O-(3-hydroxymyristoyl)glucosamine N-acyltransferase [Pleionea sediminis]
MSDKGYTLEEIAQSIGATVSGNAACRVFAINTIQDASEGEIAFLSNPKYQSYLKSTKASAVILLQELADSCPVNALVMDNPYLGFAKVAQLLDTTPSQTPGIHPSAVIDSTADVDPTASVGANAVIESNVTIGRNVQIASGCVIGQDSSIGDDSRLFANVSLYHGVVIGKRAIIHGGTVIGSDGFGFANEAGVWIKIPQLGNVVIGDDFECGANCTIDRGAINDTIIGDGVKLDNMCHLAHNAEFGDHSAMAAYSGVAGSSKVGKYCTISGRVSVLGHIELADGVHVTAGSQVSKSLEKGAYSSGTPLMPNREWKRNVTRLRQLDEIARTMKRLEKRLAELESEKDDE